MRISERMIFIALLLIISFVTYPVLGNIEPEWKVGQKYPYTTTLTVSGTRHLGKAQGAITLSETRTNDFFIHGYDNNTQKINISYFFYDRVNSKQYIASPRVFSAFTPCRVSGSDDRIIGFSWDPYVSDTLDYFFYAPLFIIPDWSEINRIFRETVFDPEREIGNGYNLKELLDELSLYMIMGETDLTYALSKFTNSTREWTWEFVFSEGNCYYKDYYNGSVYRKYDLCKLKIELAYSEEGLLEKFQYEEQIINIYKDLKSVITLQSGKIAIDRSTPISSLGILVSIIITVILRKNTNNHFSRRK